MKRYVVWAHDAPEVETVVEATDMDAARQVLADQRGIQAALVGARVFIQGDERLLEEPAP